MNAMNNMVSEKSPHIGGRYANFGLEIFTYVSLFFLVGVGFSSLLANYSFALANVARICAVGIGVISIVIRNPRVIDFCFWFLALGLSYFIAQRSGKMTVFFATVAVVLVSGYPTRKVLLAFFVSALIDFALLVAASGLGFTNLFATKGGQVVLSLGLVSSNTLGSIAFMFLCLIEFFLGSNRRLFTPLLLVYAFTFFGLTASRTPFVASVVLILLCAIFNDSWGRLKKPSWLCLIPFAFSVLSIGLLVLFANGNPVARQLDGLLSGRLLLNYTYNFDVAGIPLLGSSPNGIYSQTIDNVYLFMLYRCGLLGLVLYNVYYYFLLAKLSKEADPFLFILCLLMAAYGLTESTTLVSTCLNPTLLLLCTLPDNDSYLMHEGNSHD